MSENKFTFVWHIENYFFCGLDNGQHMDSPEFVDSVFRNRWILRLYPRGDTDDSRDHCSVFLKRCSTSDGRNVTIRKKLEVVKNNNDIVKSYEGSKTTLYDTKTNSWGWPEFIKIDECIQEFEGSDVFTLRCHIITDEPCKKQCATSCVARTRIGVDNFYHHWNIENFNNVCDWSESKTFAFLESYSVQSSWKFTADVLHVQVEKVNDDNKSRFSRCELTLLDKNYRKFSSQQESFLFTSKHNRWEFYSFVTKSLLKENESILLHGNNFSLIKFELAISNGWNSSEIERYIYPNTSSEIPTSTCAVDTDSVPLLLADLEELFINKKHADVQLQVGSEAIPAHKSILASRSPVFSAMFDMAGSQSSVVKIDDVDSETLNSLMEFLYTGKVDLKNRTALKLLVAADKYEVPTLATKCSDFLESALSPDNVCEILVAAEIVACVALKNAAFHFIKTNACSVLVSEKWFDLVHNNSQLGKEIIHNLSVTNSPSKKFKSK